MTASRIKKDAAIVDVLQRFQQGDVDLEGAALELMRLKERIGLPMGEGVLQRYVGDASLFLQDIRTERISRQGTILTVKYIVNENIDENATIALPPVDKIGSPW